MTAKYGLPYFQNFLNSELKPNMVRSMCCRLQLDLRELLKRGNGLFGSAEQTGSLGVVTINCARLGYLHAGDEVGAASRALDELLGYGARQPRDEAQGDPAADRPGALSRTRERYLGTLRNHFSTIGVNGINEMVRNFTRDDETSRRRAGQAFALRLLDHLRERIVALPGGDRPHVQPRGDAGRGHDLPLRARRTASAGPTSCRPAPADSAVLHELARSCPVGFTDDPFEALDAPGGAADAVHRRHRAPPLHERAHLVARAACKALVRRSLERFRLPYITDHADVLDLPARTATSPGEHEFCPKCDEERLAEKRQQRAACVTAKENRMNTMTEREAPGRHRST